MASVSKRTGEPIIDGMPKSARFATAVSVKEFSKAGPSKGIVTVRSTVHVPAPPTRAASSRSDGIDRSAAATITYTSGYECSIIRKMMPSAPYISHSGRPNTALSP